MRISTLFILGVVLCASILGTEAGKGDKKSDDDDDGPLKKFASMVADKFSSESKESKGKPDMGKILKKITEYVKSNKDKFKGKAATKFNEFLEGIKSLGNKEGGGADKLKKWFSGMGGGAAGGKGKGGGDDNPLSKILKQFKKN